MTTYTLTTEEAAIFDSGDDPAMHELADDITARFSGQNVEVVHPDGFAWLVFAREV